jgi:hypothetical protein
MNSNIIFCKDTKDKVYLNQETVEKDPVSLPPVLQRFMDVNRGTLPLDADNNLGIGPAEINATNDIDVLSIGAEGGTANTYAIRHTMESEAVIKEAEGPKKLSVKQTKSGDPLAETKCRYTQFSYSLSAMSVIVISIN